MVFFSCPWTIFEYLMKNSNVTKLKCWVQTKMQPTQISQHHNHQIYCMNLIKWHQINTYQDQKKAKRLDKGNENIK